MNLDHSNQIFSQGTPALMKHDHTKFAKESAALKKKQKSYFDYMGPDCDLDNSKTIFLQDILAHEDASTYYIWLKG